MTEKQVPVRALAQFFDDIRMEVTGKLILIGQYVDDLLLQQDSPLPFDRLAILVTMRWPRDYSPSSFKLKIEATGQPLIEQDVPLPPVPDLSDKPLTPFSGAQGQMVVNCRFNPLRIGDNIDVWIKADGVDIPAGRLQVKVTTGVIVPPMFNSPTASPPPSAQSPSSAQETAPAP